MLSLASFVQAEDACPWLTLGSAERFLKESASVAVKQEAARKGTCTFTSTAPGERLDVFVDEPPPAGCTGPYTALTGIGTEARLCMEASSDGLVKERIDGAVREIRFTLILNGHRGLDDGDGIKDVAETVAGNLF